MMWWLGISLDYVPDAAFHFICQSEDIYHGRDFEVGDAETVFMDTDRYQVEWYHSANRVYFVQASMYHSMPLNCVRLIVIKFVIKFVILIELVDMRRWCCGWLCVVSESRATVTVAAAVAGLLAGSFLGFVPLTCLILPHTHNLTPKAIRSPLLYNKFWCFIHHNKRTSARFIYNLFNTR